MWTIGIRTPWQITRLFSSQKNSSSTFGGNQMWLVLSQKYSFEIENSLETRKFSRNSLLYKVHRNHLNLFPGVCSST